MLSLAAGNTIVSAVVTKAQAAELERLAREGDRTLSAQLRIAVREYLEREEEEPTQ